MTGLSVLLNSWPHTRQPDECTIVIGGRVGTEAMKSRAAITLARSERDYVDTYINEAVQGYLYGETWRQVAKQLATVHKLARQHGVAHDF